MVAGPMDMLQTLINKYQHSLHLHWMDCIARDIFCCCPSLAPPKHCRHPDQRRLKPDYVTVLLCGRFLYLQADGQVWSAVLVTYQRIPFIPDSYDIARYVSLGATRITTGFSRTSRFIHTHVAVLLLPEK